MRCWVTLTMTCIILFCLPGYSIPRSNCSFKKLLILTPEWNVGTSGAAESNIFFHCIRFKITFLSEMNSNIIPFTEQWFATLLYVFSNNKLIKMDKYKNSANIDTPRIKFFIKSFDQYFIDLFSIFKRYFSCGRHSNLAALNINRDRRALKFFSF